MSAEHDDLMVMLGVELGRQLDFRAFRLRINAGRVRLAEGSFSIPDLFVVPFAVEHAQRGWPPRLEF
jgi:hypothetical protein